MLDQTTHGMLFNPFEHSQFRATSCTLRFYTLRIVQQVAKNFLSYDNITTTRLHGHIFSCLLEIPNVVCDNSYGKNTGYANLWTKELGFVAFYR